MISVPLITPKTIDAASLEQDVRDSEQGAVVTFQGVVRQDKTDEGEIDYLLYEAFEGMAEKEMKQIQKEVEKRWAESAMVIQHRVGRVNVGETSIFIAVSSPHRAEAFEACRFSIDRLKTTVPIWKKDFYTNGSSQWTVCSHGTMLLSDEAIAIPES